MSERPFMQLYVSDYLGDTQHLSTEQHGAYLLLLMAMWNADGSLPQDDIKLARVARLSLKRWHQIGPDVLAFFEQDGEQISQPRMTKELQKVMSKINSRTLAGGKGGRAKALKDKRSTVAIATVLLQHLPDTILKKKDFEVLKVDRLLDRDLYAACERLHPTEHLNRQKVPFPKDIVERARAEISK